MHKTKTCSRCNESKPMSRFYLYTGRCKHLAGKPHAACKDCEFADRKARRRADPVGTSRVARRAKLRRLFGITPEDYDVMLADQGGACAVCLQPSPDGRRLHVDHCHATKVVRGLLCHDCNRGIGIFKDSVERLQRAARYLQQRGGEPPKENVMQAPTPTCPCFPGTCRGGDVVNGVLANGSRCRDQS